MMSILVGALRRWKLRRGLRERLAGVDVELGACQLHRKFRRVELGKERNKLERARLTIERARTMDELLKADQALTAIRNRCWQLTDQEGEAARRITEAEAKTVDLRGRAASLPGESFQNEVDRRRRVLSQECERARQAKEGKAEKACLELLAQHVGGLAALVATAEAVCAKLPDLEKRIAELPKAQAALDLGTEEIIHDIDATLRQTRKEVVLGSYDKAAQRIHEVESLEGTLLERMRRRQQWAREEVDRWLSIDTVAAPFPELRTFPAVMTGTDVERWYALRPRVERLAMDLAEEQRLSNTPTKHAGSGYALSRTHALRMTLAESRDARKLEDFLRAVERWG
ncbi:MAG: hypothetical protein ABI693_19610 [Bryobacteraceae bacterium]